MIEPQQNKYHHTRDTLHILWFVSTHQYQGFIKFIHALYLLLIYYITWFAVHCFSSMHYTIIMHSREPSFVIAPAVFIPPAQRSCWGGILVSLRPSVRPSVCPSVRPSVRPSRMPCPLCIIYSYGWILFILGTNDHYHERVCLAPWPLTLTYIFKVIRSWLRKSCPLCSVYSSGWILSIFGTNDHYH